MELVKRVGVAFLLIPIAFGMAYFGGWVMVVFVAIMAGAIQRELLRMFRCGFEFVIFAVLFGAVSPIVIYIWGEGAFLPILLLLSLISGILAVTNSTTDSFRSFTTTIFSVTFAALPLITLVLIREGYIWAENNLLAMYVFVYIWAGVWFTDSGAYFAGRLFGKHPLAPKISPKKTIEGSIGGVVVVLIWYIFAAMPFDLPFALHDRIALGLIVGVLSQVGDLAASLAKRTANVKDSGKLLPGHGGALDRFDSTIFALPGVYLYFVVTGFLKLF